MRSSTIVLVVGLFAAPLAFLTSPDNTAVAAGFAQLVADNGVATTMNGRPLVDAPVPGVAPTGIPPASRVDGAGSPTVQAGPVDSTPFSSTPSGLLSGEGTRVANADRLNTPPNDPAATPNLSK